MTLTLPTTRIPDTHCQNLVWDYIEAHKKTLRELSDECKKDEFVFLHIPNAKLMEEGVSPFTTPFVWCSVLPVVNDTKYLNESYVLGLTDEYRECRTFFLRNKGHRDPGGKALVIYQVDYLYTGKPIYRGAPSMFENYKCGAIVFD